jgi:transposase
MLPIPKPRRKAAARHPFRAPLWDDQHPDCQRIDATLPCDHHARWLRTVVERLDLAAFRLSYAGYGSLAFPVELLLAFVLFLYSKGTLSPAQWAWQARYDDQCKWLLRGLRPSRSQLYTFRDRVEPFLDDWHKQIIAWAVAEGITTAARGSLDGTFVAALASRHQLVSSRRVDRRLVLLRLLVWLDGGQARLATPLKYLPELLLLSLGLWLSLLLLGQSRETANAWQTALNLRALLELLISEEMTEWQPRLPSWMPASVPGRQRVLKRYEQAQQRLEQRLQPLRCKKKLSKKDRATLKRLRVSLTDPEAALGWDKVGTYRPLYNVLLVQATDCPLTLAWEVLPRNNDDGLLKPMMEKTKEQLGHYLKDVLIDGGFTSLDGVQWCEKEEITVYAPPAKTAKVVAGAQAVVAEVQGDKTEAAKAEGEKLEVTQANAAAATGVATRKEEKIGKEAFRYDSKEKVYYCPQGKRLEEETRTKERRQNGMSLPMIVYRASGQDCQACPRQQQCTSNPQKGRTVRRYEGEDALERVRQRMAEPASQQVYKLRSRSVELGYADLKEHRGLRKFHSFGLPRARAQAGLVILASNGLTIRRTLQRRECTEPHPTPQEKQSA